MVSRRDAADGGARCHSLSDAVRGRRRWEIGTQRKVCSVLATGAPVAAVCARVAGGAVARVCSRRVRGGRASELASRLELLTGRKDAPMDSKLTRG